jgi:dTDP-glucose 4,6-dehydratase
VILVTGGAGFIGANFVLDWLAASDEPVINLDALTYAGNRETLAPLEGDARHLFVHGDICDRALVERLFAEHKPRAVVHFAAESHVDRSIHGPGAFVRTNVDGTFTLLEAARTHWSALPAGEREAFRFLHVSTDEVYGSLGPNDPAFTETKAYEPNSPYSASKAASDHLGKALPIYGDGRNVRDWLYVGDHCSGHPHRARARPASARRTTSVAGTRWPTSTSYKTHLRAARRTAPRRRRPARAADYAREGPPGARPPLCDRRAQDRA